MPRLATQDFDAFATATDWEKFLDGRARQLVVGVDFISVNSARTAAMNAAKRRGRKCRTAKHRNGLVVQFSNHSGNFNGSKTAKAKRSGKTNAVLNRQSAKADSSEANQRGKRRRGSER